MCMLSVGAKGERLQREYSPIDHEVGLFSAHHTREESVHWRVHPGDAVTWK